jgi:hypothetical protein
MLYIEELIFDERNTEHIARHGVTPEEVEEVCYLAPHFSRARSRRGRRRYRAIGQTESGRYLTIFLEPLSKGVFYPITARDATASERRLYQRHKRR